MELSGRIGALELAGIRTARQSAISSGSWNKYSYVQNDPVNHLDPTGREECDPDDPDDPCYCDDYDSCDGDGGGGTLAACRNLSALINLAN